jgi:hypothetical protein
VTEWNVNLQFDGVTTEENIGNQIDELFEPLLPLDPVASFAPGSLSVAVTVEAKTPDAALKSARRQIAEAMNSARFGEGVLVGIEMHTNEELDRLNAIPNYPEVVGVAEVASMLGVSKQRVSELARSRTFPPPLYELAAGPVWVKGSIETFVEKWERKPGRPRKAATA